MAVLSVYLLRIQYLSTPMCYLPCHTYLNRGQFMRLFILYYMRYFLSESRCPTGALSASGSTQSIHNAHKIIVLLILYPIQIWATHIYLPNGFCALKALTGATPMYPSLPVFFLGNFPCQIFILFLSCWLPHGYCWSGRGLGLKHLLIKKLIICQFTVTDLLCKIHKAPN